MSSSHDERLRAAALELLSEAWRGSGRSSRLSTRGISMRPLIQDQDSVTLEHVDPGELRAGELAAFRKQGEVVVHRVLALREIDGRRKVLEKGDNVMGLGTLELNSVLGRVVTLEPRGGRPVDLRRPAWRALGRALALYGRLALRLSHPVRGSGPPARPGSARRLLYGVLLAPPRLLLWTLRLWVAR